MAPKSTLSPAELAQLEHAFATDPTSDAYRPLAEAYLSMGRYMEAMVVCKKGVKAHPGSSSARVLLARVYAEQGKDKKALEELQGALTIDASDAAALRMLGSLQFKGGDAAAGAESLRKAFAANPADPETIELCKKHGVEVAPPAPAAPAPAPAAPAQPAAPPVLTPAAAAPQPPVLQPAQPQVAAPAATRPAAPQSNAAPQPATAAPARAAQPQASRPAAKPRPKPQPRPAVTYEELAAKYGDPDEDAPRRKGSSGLVVTLLLAILGIGGLGGYYVYSKEKAAREGQISKLLRNIQDELARDSYASYKKATELGETIVSELDPDLFSAHAYLAYAYAIRWGEHGEGDLVERNAREHLAKAKAANTEHSHLIAAEAFIRFFGGEAQVAQQELEKQVEDAEARGKKSALLYATLGILQMHAGDLDKAQKNLKLAQTLAPADPRISAALGNVLRRQGNEFSATNAYDTALRYERNHAEALLGFSLMHMESDKPEARAKAKEFLEKLTSRDMEPPPSARQLALARMARAIVLDGENKKEEADRLEAQALDADPRNGELHLLKSRRLARAGKQDEAIAAIREAIRLEPKRASFYVDLAGALVQKPGGAREAVEAVQEALKTMPGTPKLLVLLGHAHLALKEYDKAKEQYEKALAAANDKLPEARMALADLAHARREYPRALELYAKAINEYLTAPDRQAYGYTEMGRIAEAQGDRAKALDLYKKAGSIDQMYAPPYYFIGRMFIDDRDRSKRAQALKLYAEYLKLAPKGEYAEEVQRALR